MSHVSSGQELSIRALVCYFSTRKEPDAVTQVDLLKCYGWEGRVARAWSTKAAGLVILGCEVSLIECYTSLRYKCNVPVREEGGKGERVWPEVIVVNIETSLIRVVHMYKKKISTNLPKPNKLCCYVTFIKCQIKTSFDSIPYFTLRWFIFICLTVNLPFQKWIFRKSRMLVLCASLPAYYDQ